MERIEAIRYTAHSGDVIVTDLRFQADPNVEARWHVADAQGEHAFATVPQWMQYIRETHGWPLASKMV